MTAAAPLGVVTFLFTDIEGSTRPGPSGFRGRWTGWRLHRPTSVGLYAISCCCGCARCWPKRVVRQRVTEILSSDTARSPHRWATKGTWHGPRR